MNPFQYPVTCQVCGGDGVGTMKTSAAQWIGGFISHVDPRVCAAILRDREHDSAALARPREDQ